MKIKLSIRYKNIDITIENDVVTSVDRAKAVKELAYACENVDETFSGIVRSENVLDPDVEEDYSAVTEGQIKYLKALGATEDKIKGLKTKSQASALITKLQAKK